MNTLIIALYVVGILLVLFEVILPGGIAGTIGGIGMLIGAILAFREYGPIGGAAGLAAGLLVLGLGLLIEFKILPKTRLGKRMFLSASVTGRSTERPTDTTLIGRICETTTALAPSGFVILDGKKYEAFSQSGFIECGHQVTVKGSDNFRLIVAEI